MRARHWALFLAIALPGAGLDLLTKHLAFKHVGEYEEVQVLGNFFSFGHTLNPGVIFGKGQGMPKFWLVVSVAAVPAILAIFHSVRKLKWILTVSLGMILAGTIGNMFDRLVYGAVRDFIKFHNIPGYGTWPLFNLADSFICVGVFLLSIEMLFFDEKERRKAAAAPPAVPAPAVPIPAPGDAKPAP